MATYEEIQEIKDPKKRLFAIVDRIDEIKNLPFLSFPKPFELDNLEKIKMDAYSEWKD